MKITKAAYLSSVTNWEKCPSPTLPEYAFIGRSNVGKSSLINALTRHKSLAKTSGKPGKTRCINHFSINDTFYLADLPGYGYAQVSKSLKKSFNQFTVDYIQHRPNLCCLFVLIDIRHTPQKIDCEFLTFCATIEVPFIICFTKADKVKKNKCNQTIQAYKKTLAEEWEKFPDYIVTSAENQTGIKELRAFIQRINTTYKLT